ncbi:MAG: hypothetical protein L6Q51_00820 [Cyclobacteriaceae bacterium]|nr:hypothetical protein [Cyclobacteriaceae bacterium]
MRFVSIPFLLTFFLVGCDREDNSLTVTFTGTVRHISTNEIVPDVLLELIVIDDDIPFDRGNPGGKIVRTDSITTNEQGVYIYSIPVNELPKNASYFIRLITDSLLHIDKNSPFPCMADGVIFSI